MKIAIHQPNFFPWLGYFSKICASDIFIFLDDVQYVKNSFINRNRIRIMGKEHWVTVPVRASIDNSIRQTRIDNDQNWKRSHLRTFAQYYRKGNGYIKTIKMIEEVYANEYAYIDTLNIDLVKRICQQFSLNLNYHKSSEYCIEETSTARLVELTKRAGGDCYLSGRGAQAYQEKSVFLDSAIAFRYVDFQQMRYAQLGEGFVGSLSVLDYLFNTANPNIDSLSYKISED